MYLKQAVPKHWLSACLLARALLSVYGLMCRLQDSSQLIVRIWKNIQYEFVKGESKLTDILGFSVLNDGCITNTFKNVKDKKSQLILRRFPDFS